MAEGLVTMNYTYGATKATKEAQELETVTRKKAAELARLNAELDARIEQRKRALRHIKPAPTYQPTPSAAAAWERFKNNLRNAEPPENGWLRLQAATREAADHDARKAARKQADTTRKAAQAQARKTK
jgi:hypothetical protein